MLTELNQFKVIKSHSNLPTKQLSPSYDAKLSLQLPKSTLFNRNISRKNIIPNHNIETNTNLTNSYIALKQSHSNPYIKSFSGLAASQHFKQKQNIYYQQNHLNNSQSKNPLILSKKKLLSLSKQKTYFSNNMHIMRNSNHKGIIEKEQYKSHLFSQGLQKSSQNNSISKKITFSKQLKYKLFSQSKNAEQGKGDLYFLQSSSHQNSSETRQNLFSMTKSAKLQNAKNNFCNQAKKTVERSNSFRKAIEVSREKRKESNQKAPKLSGKQTKLRPLNGQYYLLSNCEKENRDPNPNRNAKFKQSLKQSRLIKSPQGKQIKENKESKFRLNRQGQVKVTDSIFCSRQPRKGQKNIEYFIDDTVNNSHMFSFGADQKSFNMEPF